jgi:hypothetical protein
MRRLVLVLALVGCESNEARQPAPPPAPPDTTDATSQSSRPAPSNSGRQTFACGEEIVTDEGIGALRIGATVSSIRQKCNVLRDTTALADEGMPARKLTVAFSRDTVEAQIVDGRVWRIAVHAPRLQTADSLGVGITLARLLRLRNPRGMTGEGMYFVASPEHCGMSFRLANAGLGAWRGDQDSAGLARLPRSSVVSEVLVFGCRSQTSGG